MLFSLAIILVSSFVLVWSLGPLLLSLELLGASFVLEFSDLWCRRKPDSVRLLFSLFLMVLLISVSLSRSFNMATGYNSILGCLASTDQIHLSTILNEVFHENHEGSCFYENFSALAPRLPRSVMFLATSLWHVLSAVA